MAKGPETRSQTSIIRTPSSGPAISQSPALLNSEFARNAAQRLSVHLTGNARSPRDRVGLCYQLTLARAPRLAELAAALELMAGAQNPLQGLADLSLAIFNLNEFFFQQ